MPGDSRIKVFLTGATGFIGTHVVRRLSATAHQVVCFVRKNSDIGALKQLDVRLAVGDLMDRNSLGEGMKDCDWVIDLANVYSFWVPDMRVYTAVNIEGTRNVLECALQAGVAKVIHVSTCGIYGKPAECPFTENSQPGPVRFGEYFRTKFEGDRIAWDLYQNKHLPLVMVHPCAVLGPGDPKASGRYVQDLLYRRMPATVFNDSILTWVHVKDVAESIVRAAEKEGNIGEKYLIGKYRMSLAEFNTLVSDIADVPLPRLRLPDFLVAINARILTTLANLSGIPPKWGMSVDQMRVLKEGFQVDGSKAERELGIDYTSIRVALEEAIASYRSSAP